MSQTHKLVSAPPIFQWQLHLPQGPLEYSLASPTASSYGTRVDLIQNAALALRSREAQCPSPRVPAAELQGTHGDQRRRGGAWRMSPGSWKDLLMSTGKPSRGAQNRTREPAIALLALVYLFHMLSCSDGRNNKLGVRTSAFSYLGDHWHLVISLILTFLFRKTGL